MLKDWVVDMVNRLIIAPLAAVLAVLGAVGLVAGLDAPGLGLLVLAVLGVGWIVLSGRRSDPPVDPLGNAVAVRAVVVASCAVAVGLRDPR